MRQILGAAPANVAVINQGMISADVSGGTITINAQPFSNQGLAQGINGGTLTLHRHVEQQRDFG